MHGNGDLPLIRCPDASCDDSEPFDPKIISSKNILNRLNALKIKCISDTCQGKGYEDVYEKFIKDHEQIHFKDQAFPCPLQCGKIVRESSLMQHAKECPNSLHELPGSQNDFILISHKECRTQIEKKDQDLLKKDQIISKNNQDLLKKDHEIF